MVLVNLYSIDVLVNFNRGGGGGGGGGGDDDDDNDFF